MKNIYYLLLCSLFWSCASTPKPSLYSVLKQETCPDFAGYAVAESEKAAIDAARAQIASEVKSSITVSSELISTNINQEASNAYKQQIISNYSLDNASDAKVKITKQQGTEFGAVVCMSKADAAKGFLEQQRLITDSLEIVAGTVLNTQHPKQKNDAWHKTGELYNRFVGTNSLLEGWGIKSPYAVSEIYAKARDNYKEYCQSQKIYWQDAGNECSAVAFSEISKTIKAEKSGCSSGLNLKFFCEEKCKSFSMGIDCAAELSLSIEACGGESYSLLKAKEPVVGNDIYSENKAKRNLIMNMQKATFFAEWQKEINGWVAQCGK